MKLRFIIFILAMLSFLSTVTGGYLYYTSLKKNIINEAHLFAEERTRGVADHINRQIGELQRPDARLADYGVFRQALQGAAGVPFQDEASTLLKKLSDSMHSSLNYLMDKDGNVVATSDYLDLINLLGNNYSFRPYFHEAIQGNPAIYLALGATTLERGIYYSYPVYGNENSVIGVVVFKMRLEYLDDQLEDSLHQGTMFLVSPQNIIFAADNEELLYKSLWKIAPDILEEISAARQFGKGPWEWIGLSRQGEMGAVDETGHRFLTHQHDITILPGWQVVYLHDLQAIDQKMTTPLFEVVGKFIVALILLVGVAVFFLYSRASHDILRRRKAESEKDRLIGELQEALEEIKTLQGIIPICSFCKKIRDDQGAWNAIESYISTHSDAQFTHGLCPDCAMSEYGISEDDLKEEADKKKK